VRIVDITTVLMGPYATQILGDLGADVLKIEPPGGDSVRDTGVRRNDGMAGMFLHVGRNKRSLVLDLKRTEAREAVLRLAADADVLVYNVRPQAMARLGLDYEAVAAVNPRIVYVGCYGYGQSGPYAARPAYDDLIQGASGLATLARLAGADEPRYAPAAIADRIVGMAVANAITAALFHRERTGRGQSVGVPMFETMAQFVLGDHMGGHTYEPPIAPTGYARLLDHNRKPYATQDGHVCVLIYNDKQWQAFFEFIGQPDLMRTDARFRTMGERTKHIAQLYRMVAEVMKTRTSAEWIRILQEIDIPVMPMHTMESLLADPHLNAVGFFETVDHPSEGRVRQMAVASSWSDSQPGPARPAPRLGEHSAEILREAGYADETIARLAESGITRIAPQS
jgi:crotonobetainyl-CoA:carnitine CoA-transferase CaiB-like acyl-CoA transferase